MGLRLIPILLLSVTALAMRLFAQDLSPRAYVITPVHTNAIIVTWSFYDGGLNLNGTVPITGATATYSVPVLSYYHSFDFLGRSANVSASLPYGVGTFEGDVLGTQRSAYRSGLLDLSVRFAVNLKGGPAMPVQDFLKWKQKTLLGASLKVIAPTGQYSGTKLVNWGINRWAFKPELGYSRRFGKWILDAYGGAWFFTTNNAFPPTRAPQTEGPIGSFEGHLSRDLGKYRLWASLDGNVWFGGTTTLNGIENPGTRQTSSRVGGTLSVPVSKHQSIKFAYSKEPTSALAATTTMFRCRCSTPGWDALSNSSTMRFTGHTEEVRPTTQRGSRAHRNFGLIKLLLLFLFRRKIF